MSEATVIPRKRTFVNPMQRQDAGDTSAVLIAVGRRGVRLARRDSSRE